METEGADLEVRAAGGAMPPGAAEHLQTLVIESSGKESKTRRPTGRQEVDDIPDPVVASAFVQAEAELAELEVEYKRRAAEVPVGGHAGPAPTAPDPGDHHDHESQRLTANIPAVVEAAADAGLHFSILIPNP